MFKFLTEYFKYKEREKQYGEIISDINEKIEKVNPIITNGLNCTKHYFELTAFLNAIFKKTMLTLTPDEQEKFLNFMLRASNDAKKTQKINPK